MESKRVPEIRFEGFSGDWEVSVLGAFLAESRIKGTDGSVAKKLTVKLWRRGVVPKEEIYLGSEATQYYIRKSGQFMYGKLDFLNQAFGIIPDELDGYESTLDLPAFDINAKMNPVFLLEYVSLEHFYRYQGNLANGSRKAKRIHVDNFLKMPISVPTIEEQEKIGSFFSKLDKATILHQQNLENLKAKKKGLLQKMFPKEGEKVPELRFPGFTGEWTSCKLGEIAIITMGQSPSSEYYMTESNLSNHILVQGNADMKNGHVVPRIWTSQVTKMAEEGALILSVRAPVGDIGKTGYKVVLGRGVAAIEGENNEFLFQKFEKMKQEGFWNRVSTGSTFESINATDIKEAIVELPNETEQQKIGQFFKQLDDKIALEERELELLKETKKAFLQKMFV
ncbi:restriction endonuclease subunit S [Listeria fleischmannii]|uniref:restriction endonuclease subunit S n=1 Tax=Listeria fleischmannii TaxID=1069827 RepID=UPI001628E4C2|nr:restriction endonuclease subunit S [Listeria fleischmannii]MBC1418139.1 restriction endonuclease subunit S [Listeria fleischmannii]